MVSGNRTPVAIFVRSTKKTILRIPVYRSGYFVVRYNGRYHPVYGWPKSRAYISGNLADAHGVA